MWKGSPLLETVRGQLGLGLIIRTSRIRSKPYFALGSLANFEPKFDQEESAVIPEDLALACSHRHALSTGWVCRGSAWVRLTIPTPVVGLY